MIEMSELRILALAGLLVTALVAVGLVTAAWALAGWLGRLWHAALAHRVAPGDGRAGPAVSARTCLAEASLRSDVERLVRRRQAAWRLRC